MGRPQNHRREMKSLYYFQLTLLVVESLPSYQRPPDPSETFSSGLTSYIMDKLYKNERKIDQCKADLTKEIEALKSSQSKVQKSGKTGLTSTNSDIASLKQKNSDLENEVITLKTKFLQLEGKFKNNNSTLTKTAEITQFILQRTLAIGLKDGTLVCTDNSNGEKVCKDNLNGSPSGEKMFFQFGLSENMLTTGIIPFDVDLGSSRPGFQT